MALASKTRSLAAMGRFFNRRLFTRIQNFRSGPDLTGWALCGCKQKRTSPLKPQDD
jgi:hypothetical protein